MENTNLFNGEGIMEQIRFAEFNPVTSNLTIDIINNFIRDLYGNLPEVKYNNINSLSKIDGFEAIVTKLNDDRTWVRINGREYLLDEMKQIVSNSDRAADLPVDYNWRKEYERRDKSIGNSGYSVKLEYTKEELYKTMCDDSNYIWSPFVDSNNY